MDYGSRLKRLRTLADVLDPGRRERWREHKSLLYPVDDTASSHSAPPLKDILLMGSCTSNRPHRNSSVIIFSDEDDDDDDSHTPNSQEDANGSTKPEPKTEQQLRHVLNLSQDMIHEILCRMSWSSICRLKCASMSWYAYLKSFSLSSDFLSLCNKEPELLAGMFYQHCSSCHPGHFIVDRVDIQVKFTPFGSEMEQINELRERGLGAVDEKLALIPINFCIAGCLHGLLLCSRPKHYKHGNSPVDRYYVCNPITKAFIWLPKAPESNYKYSKTGFLVDEETGQYQVVQIPVTYSADPIHGGGLVVLDLYSSSSCTWRTERFTFHGSNGIAFPPSYHFYLAKVVEGPTVQMGGSLYWVGGEDMAVYCCSIERKKIRFIKRPEFESLIGRVSIPCLGEFNCLLHYVVTDSRRLWLWVFLAGEWELVSNVLIDTVTRTLSPCFLSGIQFEIKPLALQAEMVFLKLPRIIIMYNFVSKRVEMLRSFDSSIQEHSSINRLLAQRLTPNSLFPYLLPKMPFPVF